MKINKIISGVFSLLILSSFIGCTEIEDHPDGRTDYSDLFTTNRKTYTYMNQCYGWILNYGMNYNYTMLAGCTDEAKDSWELQNGVTRKWNEGQLSPFSNPLEGIEVASSTARTDLGLLISKCTIISGRIVVPRSAIAGNTFVTSSI